MDRRSFVLGGAAACGASAALGQSRGRYIGQLELTALSGGRLMRLSQPYTYIDPAGRTWAVPARAVVDGASIPRVFWTVVGGPWDGPYRDASVIHDWFCAVRTKPWKETHRMFYDAMLTSQVPSRQARLMFLAVRYAGPSWDDLTLANSRLLTNNGQTRLDPAGTRRGTSNFASASEAAQAREALLARLNDLADEADGGDLTVAQMEQLVDAGGREESTAAMLES